MKFMKKYTIFFFLIIIYLSGLVSYSNSFDGEFVFDDFNSIVAQEKNFKLKRLDEMWRINKSRFIPFITYKLNYRIDELNPRGYHVFNFSIHILIAFIQRFALQRSSNSNTDCKLCFAKTNPYSGFILYDNNSFLSSIQADQE